MIKKLFIICSLLWLCLLVSVAAIEQRFNYITTKDGLYDNTVWTVYQDEIGFIWLGTSDGLYRYDGHELVLVRRNFFKNRGKGNSVSCIQEDKKRKILWLSVDNHIFTYNMLTETLNEEFILPVKGTVSDLCFGSDGILWIAVYEKGIYCYTPKDEKAICFKVDGVDLKNVIRIKESNNGIYGFLTKDKGTYLYNKNTKETERYVIGETSSAFLIDSNHDLWVGTQNGLCFRDPKTEQTIRVSLRESFNVDEPFITEIVESKDGNYLYLSTDRGLYVYTKKDRKIQILQSEYESNYCLNNNYLNSVYVDRENTIWVSTYFGGVNFMSEYSQNFLLYASINREMDGHVISAYVEDSLGNLWIGSEDGGLTYFDKTTLKTINYNPKVSKQSFLDFYNIHGLLLDKDELYIGMSRAGVNIYNIHTKSVKRLREKSVGGLSSASIYSFEKISPDEIAIGGFSGLDIYNRRTGLIKNISEIPKQTVNCILKDDYDGIWVCGKNLGVYYKEKNKSWKDLTKENSKIKIPKEVYTIAQKDKLIFLGTQDFGIITYDLITKQRSRILYDELKELTVHTIIPEKDWLWVCTSNGLYYYHFLSGEVRHFTENDGLTSSQTNWNSGILQRDGTIFIGGLNGCNAFRTEDLHLTLKEPKTVITNLFVNNKELHPSNNESLLKESIIYTDTIELSYQENDLAIQCATLSSFGHASTLYQYKMFPIDEDWKSAKTNIFNYNQLTPGTYVFTACGSRNNVWDKKGVKLYIKILPPWWARWYMILLYIILLFFCGWNLFRRWYRNQKGKLVNQKEEELYRSKLEFLTNIIHEIRTPLTLILSPLKVIEKRSDVSAIQFELEIMRRNGDRLLHLINQLMDYRKLDSDWIFDIEENRSIIDICAELENLCFDFKFEAQRKNIVMTFVRGDSDKSIYINAVKEYFDKIIINILSNALKFAKKEITIHVKQETAFCYIYIADDGPGIPEAKYKSVFLPFYQLKEYMPKDNIGTGVGLAIVKKMIERMNWNIKIDSEIGYGTRFIIGIPILENFSKSFAENFDAKVSDNSFVNINHKYVIAVVEDNHDLCDFIVSFLSDEYDVHAYSDGDSLLHNLDNIHPDMIVSDIMMPGVDGIELCKTIKGSLFSSHIPVILLTAKSTESDEIDGLSVGADDYIKKPFSPDVLKARIKNIFVNRERLLENFRSRPDIQLEDILTNQEDQDFINKVNEIIAQNLTNSDLSVQFVISKLCVSRSLFFLKMKNISGLTFTDYVRIARLKRAVELMKRGERNFNEIAFQVGFSSSSYFCKCFKKQFNMTPSEYLKEKHNIE